MNLLNVEDLKFLLMPNLMKSLQALSFVNTYWISSVWETTAASIFRVLPANFFLNLCFIQQSACSYQPVKQSDIRHIEKLDTADISCVIVLNKFGGPGCPTSLTPTHKICANEQKNTKCREKCMYIELCGADCIYCGWKFCTLAVI